MTCVVTLAIVSDGTLTIGHVGDSRLYMLTAGGIRKLTHDHSPVGEREDAHEISEAEAMRHPRRNEVYRDVGSEPHEAWDPDFIDLHEIPFEPDAAFLLCSDGLTDLVDSTTISDVVAHFAGRPHDVVSELIQAANEAGGKDNVTVVYVEGEEFAVSYRASEQRAAPTAPPPAPANGRRSHRLVQVGIVALLAVVLGYAMYRNGVRIPLRLPNITAAIPAAAGGPIVIMPSESIAVALAGASSGATLMVEPGEYRERLVLTNGVRVVSRVPRAATLRLPSTASEGDPAVVADGVSGAELAGFRIVGDAATPLGTGVFAKNADVSIVDVEITGAANVAIDLSGAARLTLLASHIHDNPGAALTIRDGASPRISQNVFSRNGLSARIDAALVLERNTRPTFFGNVFQGVVAEAFRPLGDAAMAEVGRDNWFVEDREAPSRPASVPRGRRGR
jgi:hypothetical protein